MILSPSLLIPPPKTTTIKNNSTAAEQNVNVNVSTYIISLINPNLEVIASHKRFS